MLLADKLKYLMIQAGVSSAELAFNTNIERSTLTKILNGTTTAPRIDTIHTLAKYFNVDINKLVDNDYEASFKFYTRTNMQLKDVLNGLMLTNGIATISLLNKYSGVPLSILSDILNGKTKQPQIKTLQQLAEFFNITVAQLSGIDPIPSYKTISVVPTRQVLPIFILTQVDEWIEGKLKIADAYLNCSRSIVGDKSYAIKILDKKYIPDFNANHTLVVDNQEEVRVNDFIIAKVGENVSIYECCKIKEDTFVLREAGNSSKPFIIQKNQVALYGVVVQQLLNR